jgi:hypothetical protein
MQNSSAFQFLALDTIHESAANPRRTFEESKLHELADYVAGHIIGILFRWPFCGRGGERAAWLKAARVLKGT